MTTRSMALKLGLWTLAVADEYSRCTGRGYGTIGLRAIGDARFLTRISGGDHSGYTLGRLDRLIRWFYDEWPAGAVWPMPPRWPYSRPGAPSNGKACKVKRTHGEAAGPAKKTGGRSSRSRPKRSKNGQFSRV